MYCFTKCCAVLLYLVTYIKMAKMEVIVIGSGVAGVAAMRRLNEHGIKAICLEAAERTGGRVTSLPFGEDTVDLGANFCEGEEGNILYEMAKPHGLLELNPEPAKTQYLLSNNEKIPDEIVEEFVSKISSYLKAVDKNNTKTIQEYLDEIVESDEYFKGNPYTPQLLEWFTKAKEYGGGTTNPKLGKSLKNLDVRKYVDGRWLTWITPGMSIIFDLLKNKYPDPSKEIPMDIKLFKEVKTIKWNNDNKLVKVSCKDGSSYEAKAVISTLTPGVLQEKTLFDPPLPKEKADIINSYGMYTLDQIFIEFAAPFWEAPAMINLIWWEEEKKLFSGNEAWITGIYALWSVARQKNVLVAWINDEDARLMEQQTDDDVHKGMEKFIKFMFKESTPVLKTLRTKWNKNRFEKGTYSYRNGLTEEAGGSSFKLAEPLLVDDFPVVCFAGEATHEKYQGSAHGAAETGFREADRVIMALKS